MTIFLVVVGAVIGLFGLFLWRYGSGAATRRVYREKFERLRQEGHPESECLFRLFSSRPVWRDMPEPFLRELGARLGTWQNVADFIHLSERGLSERETYSRIAWNDPGMDYAAETMELTARAFTRGHFDRVKTPRLAERLCRAANSN